MIDAIRRLATDCGFDAVGAVRLDLDALPFSDTAFQAWLDAGFSAGMEYMANRREAFADPRLVLSEVRCVLVLGVRFQTLETLASKQPTRVPLIHAKCDHLAGCGRVAHYAASGWDYHDLIRGQLKELQKGLKTLFPDSISRGVVDTAPLHERDWARKAGLGFRGRNRMLIHPTWGSRLFLAAVLTSAELPEFREFPEELLKQKEAACARCGRCLAACPTGALRETGVDARRCLSYLTIEHRGEIPSDLARLMGSRLFGCDACTDCCPHNAAFRESGNAFLELEPILSMTDEAEFRAVFAHSPFLRCKLEGMQRNARIVTENEEHP